MKIQRKGWHHLGNHGRWSIYFVERGCDGIGSPLRIWVTIETSIYYYINLEKPWPAGTSSPETFIEVCHRNYPDVRDAFYHALNFFDPSISPSARPTITTVKLA